MKLSTAQLREVKLMQGFSDEDLEVLLAGGETLTFEALSLMVIEGEPSGGLFFLTEGQAGIFKTNKASGDLVEIAHLRAGNSFGEMSLIDDAPRSATVQALTACTAFHLPSHVFTTFLSANDRTKCEFYQRCVAELAKRLRSLDDHYVDAQYQLWKVALKGDGKKAA
jgi:CRP-like cAMP-binding protein